MRFNSGLRSVLMSSISLTSLLAFLSGCSGPRAFTKGEYDDPNRVELLDDRFNENDMQQLANTVIKDLVSCGYIAKAQKPPVVLVDTLKNKTQEHIDTNALTDRVRRALNNSGKVEFIKTEDRDKLQEEYAYHEAGNVTGPTQKKKGKQIGADYMLTGNIMTNIQEVGSDKFVYYQLTVDLTNIETSITRCTTQGELRKRYEKRRIGL